MFWLKWFPWRLVISRLARSQGFLDPVALMSRLHRFAQPSEVAEPIELLRAGVVFHARGLVNTRAIQHNLDWVWPWWVEQQFDPHSDAFVPRAFSITHVNLTHRNWTAVGLPDVDFLPIVDPRGLVTPTYDGWSTDAWIVPDDGEALLPSRCAEATQTLTFDPGPVVTTRVAGGGMTLSRRVAMVLDDGQPTCRETIEAKADRPARLALALRPVNPEGVSFIHAIEADPSNDRLLVNDDHVVTIDRPADAIAMSRYHDGDVLQQLPDPPTCRSIECEVGMATAAAMYRIGPGRLTTLTVGLPLAETPGGKGAGPVPKRRPADDRPTGWPDWDAALQGTCEADLPDELMQRLFDQAARTLILHSPGEVYPGPYTYKRFWFRDAALILDGLLALGCVDRVGRCIDLFPDRQTIGGYFRSQEGEWDSNGEALWIMERYARLSGRTLGDELLRAVRGGARWIDRKCTSADGDEPHAGLLPAGFSAEHLGPNDYYYWDDFWSIAGLNGAASLLEHAGEEKEAGRARDVAERISDAIELSLRHTTGRRDRPGIPASPYRRMDAGAIGSIAAGYPLQLWPADDERLIDTVDFLINNCTVNGGFFQDMIHSGINAYLTLHLAQVLLRAGDRRFNELIRAVADLASPTGQWPEAIHPRTGGGCMGDGQHVWAAAEWVLMIRNAFVREEAGELILAAGVLDDWLKVGEKMSFGPTPTSYGPITVTVEPDDEVVEVTWQAKWRGPTPAIHVRPPGCSPVRPELGRQRAQCRRDQAAALARGET